MLVGYKLLVPWTLDYYQMAVPKENGLSYFVTTSEIAIKRIHLPNDSRLVDVDLQPTVSHVGGTCVGPVLYLINRIVPCIG